MKILPVGAGFHVDGRTDVMKLIFAFHSFTSAPKNHKKSHELRLIRPQTQHQIPEHVFKFHNIANTLYGENCESFSCIQVIV